ncbi:transcriptional activator, Zn-finger [Scheffersomyces amazonensis]|uniref:transcriptional activator, Zn-finger n=1 Tax=Scheffersomyces amazonensis TaxID=1078765 RepID=UPI00315D6B94
MYINLSSTFNLFLDDRGLKHLDFFENQVAPMISVSPQSSNYFLKTFFTLAITNESISNGLAAWGALFDNAIEGEDKYLTVNRYLQRGNELIHKNEISTNNDRFDSFIKLAYYLIVIGIHICSGDTKQWHDYFNRCVRLFKDYGGIVKFINDFKYSNDCKFLISNFQFHDVMSSETLKNGTICSMNNYNDLFKFNKILELDDYGIDPYQGCIQSVYLLLGEIMNSYVELKEERFNLNKLLNSSTSGDSGPVINNLRLSYLKRVNEKISELSNKIEYCQPNETQMNQLEEIDQANHLKLFELYRITCKMYLSLYLKQSQPISSEMQNYLINAQGIMDELIQTNLISSLNMSLLICGISCCNKFDRQNLNDKFCSIYERYQVGNVKRIWDVVREAWRRNPYGIVCIDWLDICNDFGWKISMC